MSLPAAELQLVLERLAGISIVARQAVEAVLTGNHRSVRRGLSVEFAGHRPYQAGDDPRHLDWLVHARTDRYDVRLYDEETRLRATVLIDASGSHAHPEVYARVTALAGALAVLLIKQSDAVGLALVHGAKVTHMPAASGLAAVGRLLDALAASVHAGNTALGAAAEALAPHLPRRGLTLLISDGLEDPQALRHALRILRHRRQEIRVLRVLHPDVETFPLHGTVKCLGLEGERPLLVDADRVRDAYRAVFSEHADELARACHESGAGLVIVRTDEDLGQALGRVLTAWSHAC